MTTDELGLPTPKEIKALEDVIPGISKEFLASVRHKRRCRNAELTLAFLGPVLGFIIVLAFLGTAAWLIFRGFGLEGTFLGVVDIASLASVFAIGQKQGGLRNNSRELP